MIDPIDTVQARRATRQRIARGDIAPQTAVLFSAARGYDKAALAYKSWHWFRFWRLNEMPLVARWTRLLPVGPGLDAGCGLVPYAHLFAPHGLECVGVDCSTGMLMAARRARCGLPLVRADICSLPFPSLSFSWILCTRVLSHVMRTSDALKEFSRVLRPGGQCLITDIHPEHDYEHTSIRTSTDRIHIQTFQHSLEQLRRDVAATTDVELQSIRQLSPADLHIIPPDPAFAALRANRRRPLLYVLQLVKAKKKPLPILIPRSTPLDPAFATLSVPLTSCSRL